MDNLICVLYPSKSGADHFVFRHASWFYAFFIDARFSAAIYLTINLMNCQSNPERCNKKRIQMHIISATQHNTVFKADC